MLLCPLVVLKCFKISALSALKVLATDMEVWDFFVCLLVCRNCLYMIAYHSMISIYCVL